jgi:RNA polymerase sigma-70 factor (ECF subfamily)
VQVVTTDDLVDSYTTFVLEHQAALRRALVAGFGPEVGREAAEEALIYGWRHWPRVRDLDNTAGYLFRVGTRIAGKLAAKRSYPLFPEPPPSENPGIEPGLRKALTRLSERQRIAVVLVHAYGLTQRETAQLLGVSKGTLQRHLERGLRRLRSELGVARHA